MKYQEQEKYDKAKKRVKEIKGFYVHLAVYLVVNAVILFNVYRYTDHFWHWSHFTTLFFWGIGLGFHAMNAFRYNPLFGKKWEERQIQKYIDEDKREADKYL